MMTSELFDLGCRAGCRCGRASWEDTLAQQLRHFLSGRVWRSSIVVCAVLVVLNSDLAVGQPVETPIESPLELRTVVVNGKNISVDPGGALILPSHVETFDFVFASNPLSTNAPVRFAWQLDGFQSGWQQTKEVDMRIVMRFFDEAKEFLAEESFPVHGQSPGWTGRFRDSLFIKRSETVTVPAGATRLWVVISSAGPPEAIGAYVVRELVISQPSTSTERVWMIPRMAPDVADASPGHSPAPPGWIRDGLRLNDAQVVRYGTDGKVALAIVDRGVDGHADWASLRSDSVPVVAGEPILVEWEEAYSISRGDYLHSGYRNLPAGLYRLRLGGLTVMGVPTGVEVSIPVTVPVAFWTTPWFWSMVVLVGVGFALAGWRVMEWRRVMRQVKIVERDHVIEQERVRIAQDIHDDLGARVTQISLLSSAAQKRHGLSEQAREDFEQVSQLSRSMVTALYETVWAVAPENDHLDELGAYICQMTTQMCNQANVKCRLTVPDLPQDIPLGSKFRHEIIMTVKEAIHNVIRHSGATEVQVGILYENRMLTITVSDNGSGFDPATPRSGNGVYNMKRRMESCQGTCSVRSRPGDGSEVRLELFLSKT